ncbi:retrovirus-related pol polyprotein from transposon TNT 1-94 [Tanacetum coccineum]
MQLTLDAYLLPYLVLLTWSEPLMTTSVANNLVFRGFFEKQKLTGPNFIDWYRQLRIVLSVEDKLNYLEHPIPAAPVPAQACTTGGAALECARISFLQAGRRANYNMHSMGKTINELHAMLKLHEQTLPKNNAPALHAIRAGKLQFDQSFPDTVPPIPPPFGANTSNPNSPNRAGNPIDNINNPITVNVAQNVVDENLPQLLDSRGGSHVTNVLEFDKEDYSDEKDRVSWVYLDGLEPYLLEILENGPFVPLSPLYTSTNPLSKPQNQWSHADRRLANQDKRLTTLEGERVNGTFTRLKCLLNVLENNGVLISQAEVNATFVNSLPRKWLSMNQTQRANNSIKNDTLAALYGKYNYKEGLIDQIYESESTRFTLQAANLKALISNSNIQESDYDVEEDQRSSGEFLADLNVEFHERALLANQRRFYKKIWKGRHFQKDCPSIKTSTPPYSSASKLYNKSKFHPNSTPQHNQSVNNNQKDYRVKYKGLKDKIVVLTKNINAMNQGKNEKELVAESFNWDEESIPQMMKGVLMVFEITMTKSEVPLTHSESEGNTQRPMPSLPKLKGVKPSGTTECLTNPKNKKTTDTVVPINVKQKTETKSPPDSSTEKLLLTLMQEIFKRVSPKVVFGDNSSGDTEGYDLVNCNGITFTKVAYVNGLKHNLISISQLCDSNFKVLFTKIQGTIFNQNNKVVLIAPRRKDAYVENLNEVKVKELRSNNGTEFKNHKLEELCEEKGISQNFSSPCTPEQNGVAEEEQKTLIEAARTVLNMKRHGKTVYDVFRGRSPDINYFHVFGCPVHIHNHRDHLGKFDEKADDGYFLGYSLVAKAFRVFNIRRQEVEETYHVTFSEDDEVISQSSTEGDAINFNKNRSFPDDEFPEPRRKITQG